MQINDLSAGGAVGAGELEVSLLMLYTKQSFKLCNDKNNQINHVNH